MAFYHLTPPHLCALCLKPSAPLQDSGSLDIQHLISQLTFFQRSQLFVVEQNLNPTPLTHHGMYHKPSAPFPLEPPDLTVSSTLNIICSTTAARLPHCVMNHKPSTPFLLNRKICSKQQQLHKSAPPSSHVTRSKPSALMDLKLQLTAEPAVLSVNTHMLLLHHNVTQNCSILQQKHTHTHTQTKTPQRSTLNHKSSAL